MADSKKTKKELIEAVEALQESEEKWHLLAENVPDVILTVGKDSRIQFLNRTVAGYDPESAIGTTIYEYVPPDQHHIMRESIERVFLTGKPDSYEIDGVGEHGPNTKWETRVIPIRRDGQVVAVNLISTDVTERKKAEAKAEKTHVLLRAIIEETPDCIFLKDRQSRYQILNTATAHNLGKTSVKEIAGRDDMEILSPEQARRLQEADRRIMDSGKSEVCEEQVGNRTFLSLKTPYRDKEDNVIGIIGIARDITERKKAEAALRESEERYKALFQGAAEGIIVADTETKELKYVNPAICKMLGYTEEELGRFGVRDIHPKEDLQHITSEFEAQARGEKTLSSSISCLRKDGTIMYADINTAMVLIHGRQCNVAFFTDVTERSKAEKALRQSEEQYRSLVENIGIGVSLISPEMEILAMNRQLSEWFPDINVSTKPICYKAFNRPARDDICSYCPTYKSLQDGQVHESETETPAGEKIVNYRIISSPIKDKNGKVIAAIEMVEDITEFKQIELREREHQAELAHYARLSTVGEMAFALAHELNQPLCAIASSAKAALRMMKSGDWDSNELLEAMEEAGVQAEQAGEIIRRTTKLVRKKEPHRSRVNIENIIDEAITLIEHEAQLKGITIQQVEPSEKLPMLEADAIQIEQVLLNLIHNSFDAMENVNKSKKQVTIEVLVDKDDTVQVAISDTGEGLPAENIDMVFEHFFTTKSEGLGMGLSISRSIIEAHGGRIWAEHNPAGGATFRFTLPAGRRIS